MNVFFVELLVRVYWKTDPFQLMSHVNEMISNTDNSCRAKAIRRIRPCSSTSAIQVECKIWLRCCLWCCRRRRRRQWSLAKSIFHFECGKMWNYLLLLFQCEPHFPTWPLLNPKLISMSSLNHWRLPFTIEEKMSRFGFLFSESKSTWNAKSIIFTWERANVKIFGSPQPVVCFVSSLFWRTGWKEDVNGEKFGRVIRRYNFYDGNLAIVNVLRSYDRCAKSIVVGKSSQQIHFELWILCTCAARPASCESFESSFIASAVGLFVDTHTHTMPRSILISLACF